MPASLERKGSVRTFWVSRLFRLYPLYLLVGRRLARRFDARFGPDRPPVRVLAAPAPALAGPTHPDG